MAAAGGGTAGGGGDPYRIRTDLWLSDRDAFGGGAGGYGTDAWNARNTRPANPVPSDPERQALRNDIRDDARMKVAGQFGTMLIAEQGSGDWERRRQYYVDESVPGDSASVTETRQALKTSDIVSQQPGTASAYTAFVALAGLTGAGLDSRPGALADRMRVIFRDDHAGLLDMIASILFYYDIPLLHVLPSLYEYTAAAPGLYVKGKLAPLQATQARLVAMMEGSVHSATIIGACIKAKEFSEEVGEVDPSLQYVSDSAGPWRKVCVCVCVCVCVSSACVCGIGQVCACVCARARARAHVCTRLNTCTRQGEIDRTPVVDGEVSALDSSVSELFMGFRTGVDALAVALRHVYQTLDPYFDKLVIASTEFASGGGHECRKNAKKKPQHEFDYPGQYFLFFLVVWLFANVSRVDSPSSCACACISFVMCISCVDANSPLHADPMQLCRTWVPARAQDRVLRVPDSAPAVHFFP